MPKLSERPIPKRAIERMKTISYFYCFNCKRIQASKSKLEHPTCSVCHCHRTKKVAFEAEQ